MNNTIANYTSYDSHKTLKDISDDYFKSCCSIQVQIRREEEKIKNGELASEEKLKKLRSILDELRTVRKYCRDYYDKPRSRDFSCYYARKTRDDK